MATKKINDMTPMDVGCPRLIPYGNLNPKSAGSYGSMYNALQGSLSSPSTFHSSASMCPDFKPGYSNPAFGNGWQTFSNITGKKN